MIAPLHIKAHHCSPNGLLLPHVLAQLCQDIASDHADSLGFGCERLKECDQIWALVLFQLEITRQPRYGMKLELETWPSNVSRLRASREFRMADSAGNTFVLGSSDWMVLDAQSRKPQNLAALRMIPHLRPQRLLGDKLPRHKAEGCGHELARFRIPVSALDANGHVNNTEYVRCGYDALYAHGCTEEMRGLSMSFHSEAFLGDELILRYSLENGQHCVAGYREASPVFSALFALDATRPALAIGLKMA
jgi:acyl-ACP thioesterase